MPAVKTRNNLNLLSQVVSEPKQNRCLLRKSRDPAPQPGRASLEIVSQGTKFLF